jgi:hypothetical protein
MKRNQLDEKSMSTVKNRLHHQLLYLDKNDKLIELLHDEVNHLG